MVTQLDIYRSASVLATVAIDSNTVFQREFMGTDKVVATFILPTPLMLGIDDYIIYNGRPYTIKQAPSVEHNRNGYKHDVVFYGELFNWYDKLLMDEGNAQFSYTGTPFEFLTLIMDNVQEFDPSWAIGEVTLIDEPLTLGFDGTSCYQALAQVAEAFGLEFYLDGKDVILVESAGSVLDITLEYGRGKGLYTLARKSVDEAFATEWYGFGGTQNLPVEYATTRLTLPSPIQRNIALYGRKQGTVAFDHIYPRYTGEVTSIDGEQVIFDTDIDFAITPVADGSAKIVFKTGSLGGNEFTITGWDEGTGKVTFGTKKEESGYVLPNDAVHAEVGDTYTIVGVVMDAQYVTDAVAELNAAVEDHADKNSHPKVAYDLAIDRKYIREMGFVGMVNPGDRLRVKDSLMSVDDVLRIQNVSWPLVTPSAITATISESVQYTFQERIAKDAIEGKRQAGNAQAGALFAKQAADEISNAVILQQFNRTYIGDRAVLTGAFVAGNPEDGEVAGINGTESGLDKIRFWAGSSFSNRGSAPFRVNQGGELWSTAGYIGGFAILPGRLESANSYEGGKFVLFPDDGFIAFIDNSKGVWSGIGVNTLSTVVGVRAVGRFENKETNPLGTNVSVLAIAEGALNNIAIQTVGNVAVSGALTTTNLYIFTPDDSVNTLSIKESNTAIVIIDNALYNTVYLPSVNDIQQSLGIGSSADFCVRYTVSIHYSSLNSLIDSTYDMRDQDGNLITSTAQNKGDCTEWFIFRHSGDVTAQMLNRQASS